MKNIGTGRNGTRRNEDTKLIRIISIGNKTVIILKATAIGRKMANLSN